MTDRELLLWLQGYLYDKSDLSIHEIVMLKGKIGAFLDKGDEKVVFDTTPSPRIIYNEDDSTRPRDPQSWELDPFRTTCDYTTGAEPLFPVYHISGCKFTTNEKGHLTWVDPDSKSDSEDSSSRVPVKSETEVALEVANALIETLENEVEVLQERVANLKRHNDFLVETKEDGNVSKVVQDNIAMTDRITDLEKQNEKFRGDNANLICDLEASESMNGVLSEKNAKLARVICENNEKILKRDKAVKELKFKLKVYTREIEQLEELISEMEMEIKDLHDQLENSL